ncbi:MAG: Sec-independent protein translocase protein TatB [Gammaproteobacteria bacterium]|nr:Sec-independent protein translocase protein TatB [Gammaproteobacteria bacterium]
MFDVGFWELALLGAIALLIIGPERMPAAARTAGLWVGRARRILREAKSDLDRELRADASGLNLGGIKDDIEKAGAELRDAGAASGDDLRRTFEEAAPFVEEKKSPAKKPGKKKSSAKKSVGKSAAKKSVGKVPAKMSGSGAAKKPSRKKVSKKKAAKKTASKKRAS